MDSNVSSNLKCSACGGNLTFDPAQQKLVCGSCGATYEFEDHFGEEAQEFEVIEEKSTFSNFEEGEVAEFTCGNCGAVLVTDANTTASICAYCDSPVILSSRLSNNHAPKVVIPFAFDAKQAEQKFRAWARRNIVLPTAFQKNPKLKELQGVYVPFWLYDIQGRGDVLARCTTSFSRRSGDYIVTTTNHYDVERKVSMEFQKLPADASEAMKDEYMDLIEPYEYSDLKDFTIEYLSGFSAEKYHFNDKELFPRISQKSSEYVSDFILSTMGRYETKSFLRSDFSALQRDAKYAVLPVYTLSFEFKGEKYGVVMNGQTGKIVGNPPISKAKCAGMFAGISIGAFSLISAIVMLIMGA